MCSKFDLPIIAFLLFLKEIDVYEKNRFPTKKISNKRKFEYIVSNPSLSSRVALLGCQMRWAKAK